MKYPVFVFTNFSSVTAIRTDEAFPTIDAKNCSFPFTYNGNLWYNCTDSITGVTNSNNGSQNYACLMSNRTAAVCYSSIGNCDVIICPYQAYGSYRQFSAMFCRSTTLSSR